MIYEVTLSCTYNGVMNVECESEEEAIRIAQEALNAQNLKGFPDRVEIPNGSFTFGEATADFVDKI